MKKRFFCSVFLAGVTLGATELLVGDPSFEGEPCSKARMPAEGYFRDKQGKISITEETAASGKKSLKFEAYHPKAFGRAEAVGTLEIKPDTPYRVSFKFKRTGPVTPHLVVYHPLKDGRHITQNFTPDTRKCRDEESGKWFELTPEKMDARIWLPAGSRERYAPLKNGRLFFDSKVWGPGIKKCKLRLQTFGNGTLYFDDVRIQEEKAEKSALERDAEAEEGRLLSEAARKANKELADAIKKKKFKELDFRIPLRTEFPPLKTDYSRYPEKIRNLTFDGSVVKQGGKPVFMLGGEMLDPFTMKLFGLDYYVKSAFMNFLDIKNEKTKLTLSPPPKYPYLETEINHYLKHGLHVWIDLLTGKGKRAKPIQESFPEFFSTGGHFFAWRNENPYGKAIMESLWWSAVKQTRNYPVFLYEIYNEVVYEDHSPYNLGRFRKEMRKKYRTIEQFNQRSGTAFSSFEAIVPPGNDGLKGLLTLPSANLKAEWTAFTEKRFAEIISDNMKFFRKAVPPNAKVTFQTVGGFPDYADKQINPEFSYAETDLKGVELYGVFYPQTGQTENEETIIAQAAMSRILKLLRSNESDKPTFDGEMSLAPGSVTFSEENIICDFGKKMKFRVGATGKQNVHSDSGRKEKWHLPEYDDSSWKTIRIPSMWAKEGYPQCSVGYYRAEFIPSKPDGKRYLCGNDLADRAEIYLNGELIGNTMFCYDNVCIDVTSKLKYGQKNLLAVRLENTYDRNGYFWGGIRKSLAILDVPAYSNTVFTPDQMWFALIQRAMLGYNGTCLSYFYWNWMSKYRCALMNPFCFAPEVWEKLPEIKNRINDLGPVIYGKKMKSGKIGMVYSLDSARAYVPLKSYDPRERCFDFDRWFAAANFLHRGTDVFSDRFYHDFNALKQYRCLLVRLTERITPEGLENLKRFVRNGGIVITDGVSLKNSSFDNVPLDVSGFLGAERLPGKTSQAQIRIDGIPGTFPTHASAIRGKIHYTPLKPNGAEPFARAGSEIVGTKHSYGKGMVVTFTPELSLTGIKQVLKLIFRQNRIEPELSLSGCDYAELLQSGDENRMLYVLLNWGKTAKVHLKFRNLPAGKLRIRNAITGKNLTGSNGNEISGKQLRDGFEFTLANFKPLLILIEKEEQEPLKLTGIPAGHAEALKKFWTPVWTQPKHPEKRILWYASQTSHLPYTLASAAKILRDNGIAIDCMAERSFSRSTVKVIRNLEMRYAPLSDYDLIVIPHTNDTLSEKDLTGLKSYLQTRNKSLLLLGTHPHNVHTMYPGRARNTLKLADASAEWTPVLDPFKNRDGEKYFFRTEQFARHEITKGVRSFTAMGGVAVSLKNGTGIVLSEKSSSGKGKPVLSVRDNGGFRTAIMGDSDWLTPYGLIETDNAVLWNNLAAWLCRIPPLPAKAAVKAAELPEW